MKVLICGSRNWDDTRAIREVVKSLPSGTLVIAGGARGADRIAQEIAEERIDLPEPLVINADWDSFGKRAGFLRNIQMLEQKPDRVYAFTINNSRGTRHTINEARKRNIPVEVFSRTIHDNIILGEN